MLRNYLIIALRTLIKQPLFSFIKIAGLSVGVCGCLVIFLMTHHELSVDKFHADGDTIYRVYSAFTGVYKGFNRGVPEALPGTVQQEFTGLEAVAHIHTFDSRVEVLQGSESKKFDAQEDVLLAGPEFFKVFTFHQWLAGNSKNLNEPFTVALTEAKAKKYFALDNALDAMGKSITYRDSLTVTVVGILQDVAENTDIYFTDFISNATWQQSWLKNDFNPITDWGSTNSSTQCFVKLAAGTPVEKIESQMPLLAKRYLESQEEPDPDWKVDYKLQPLRDLHYNADLGIFDSGREPANIDTIRMLAICACMLLVIAAINFVNLETAQAVRRAKEVGLRKSMGGTQSGLVRSFLLESGFIAFVAVLLALPMAQLAIPFFQDFLPKGVTLTFSNPLVLPFLLMIVVVITLLSGLYPAFVLASYQPVEALKNQLGRSQNTRSAFMRKFLTVFQFSFSQALIIGTLIVGWQIQFMINKDMGFDREAVITFSTPWWLSDNRPDVLHNELSRLPEIGMITRNDSPPARSGWSTSTLTLLDKDQERPLNVHQRAGDTSYLSLFKIPLVAGRMVQPTDSAREYLVNEAYCREMGFQPAEMVGQVVKGNDAKKHSIIVGVMRDFHLQGLSKKIEPLSFRYGSKHNSFAVKLKSTENMQASVTKIKTVWDKIYPEKPLQHAFLDDNIRKFYEGEQKVAKLTNTATALTIFISCLGLLGLAAFTATQRTKEIGIRKVLGASIPSIVSLLSREFIVLVLIAFAFAAPLAWYGGTQWLSEYAYRISIGWEVFVLAGVASVAIAFVTVAFQTLTAAWANPVESLRYE
jgi:putative ABC transport system permease protein